MRREGDELVLKLLEAADVVDPARLAQRRDRLGAHDLAPGSTNLAKPVRILASDAAA
jgi:hypothetical protein